MVWGWASGVEEGIWGWTPPLKPFGKPCGTYYYRNLNGVAM